MSPVIRFRCPNCDARIKAPGQLLGQHRNCPGCGERLVVRPQPPDDSGPLLLHDDGRSPRGSHRARFV